MSLPVHLAFKSHKPCALEAPWLYIWLSDDVHLFVLGLQAWAQFSHRAPIYPPATVSFAVGATSHALCKVEGAPRPVRATARWQVLACSLLASCFVLGKTCYALAS